MLVIIQQVQIKLFCYQSFVLSVEYETIHQFRLMFDSDLLKETRFKIHFRALFAQEVAVFLIYFKTKLINTRSKKRLKLKIKHINQQLP